LIETLKSVQFISIYLSQKGSAISHAKHTIRQKELAVF
jgi:hypothetical protein